jgi:hypothetical protein
MEHFIEYFVGGALRIGGSWGGPECLAYVSKEIHVAESISWLVVIVITAWLLNSFGNFNRLVESINKATVQVSWLDRGLAVPPALLYLYVLQTKIRIHSLVNLLQPCHLSLVLNVIALCTTGPISTCISIYSLPFVVGAWSALLIPDISGLTPLEVYLFFIQHYFLVAIPVYLLCHRNYTAYRHCSILQFINANLVIGILHFLLFECINVTFAVNVNFFLCPTPGLLTLFATLPEYLLFPSYRTFLFVVLFSLAMACCGGYVTLAASLHTLSSAVGVIDDKIKPQKSL